MITPINNSQSNLNFDASLNSQKVKKSCEKLTVTNNKKTVKSKDFGAKLINKIDNLDYDSKKALYDSIVLLSIGVVIVGHVMHFVKVLMDKFRLFVE